MLVDFGHNTQQTTQQGVTWNNYAAQSYADPTIAKGLYDQGGGYTGIVMQSKFVNGGTATGVNDPSLNYDGPYPAALTGIPQSALQDGFYVSDGNKLVLTLSQLDAHATVRFPALWCRQELPLLHAIYGHRQQHGPGPYRSDE